MTDNPMRRLVRLFARERFPEGMPDDYPDDDFCQEYIAWQERQTDPEVVRLIAAAESFVWRKVIRKMEEGFPFVWIDLQSDDDGRLVPELHLTDPDAPPWQQS
jgi:hypothetical protein